MPKEIAKGVLERAKARDEKEAEVIRRIKKGEIIDLMHNYKEKYQALIKAKKLKELPKA